MIRYRLFLLLFSVALLVSACRQDQAAPPDGASPTTAAANDSADASGDERTPEGAGTEDRPTAEAAASATPSDPLAALDPSDARILLFHEYDGAIAEALTTRVAAFNEENLNGIRVEVVAAEQGAEAAPLVDQIEAAEAMLFLGAALPPALADRAVDVAPYFASTTWSDGQEIDEPQTTVPLLFATEALYYNADLMAELGIQAPPASWDELLTLACEAGENRYGFAYPYQLNRGEPSHSAALVAANGGTVADGDTLTLDSEAARATFGALQALYRDGCMAPVVERQLVIDNFGAGTMLFVADSSTQQAAYGAAVEAGYGGAWEMVPLPLAEGGQYLTTGITASVLPSSDVEQLASWLFLRWLQGEARDRLAEATGLIAADVSATGMSAAVAGERQADPTAPFSDDVRAILEEATAQIVDQNADVEMTLTDATRELQYWIREKE